MCALWLCVGVLRFPQLRCGLPSANRFSAAPIALDSSTLFPIAARLYYIALSYIIYTSRCCFSFYFLTIQCGRTAGKCQKIPGLRGKVISIENRVTVAEKTVPCSRLGTSLRS